MFLGNFRMAIPLFAARSSGPRSRHLSDLRIFSFTVVDLSELYLRPRYMIRMILLQALREISVVKLIFL